MTRISSFFDGATFKITVDDGYAIKDTLKSNGFVFTPAATIRGLKSRGGDHYSPASWGKQVADVSDFIDTMSILPLDDRAVNETVRAIDTWAKKGGDLHAVMPQVKAFAAKFN